MGCVLVWTLAISAKVIVLFSIFAFIARRLILECNKDSKWEKEVPVWTSLSLSILPSASLSFLSLACVPLPPPNQLGRSGGAP